MKNNQGKIEDIRIRKIDKFCLVLFGTFVVGVCILMYYSNTVEYDEPTYPTRLEPTYWLGNHAEVYDVPNPDGTISRVVINYRGGIYRETFGAKQDSISQQDSIDINQQSISNGYSNDSYTIRNHLIKKWALNSMGYDYSVFGTVSRKWKD